MKEKKKHNHSVIMSFYKRTKTNETHCVYNMYYDKRKYIDYKRKNKELIIAVVVIIEFVFED